MRNVKFYFMKNLIELSDYQFTLQDVAVIKKERLMEKLKSEQRIYLQAAQGYMLYPVDSFIYESIKLLKGYKHFDKVAEYSDNSAVSFSSKVFKRKHNNECTELDLNDNDVFSSVWELKKAISNYVDENEIDVPSLNEILSIFNCKKLSISNVIIHIKKSAKSIPNIFYTGVIYFPVAYINYHGIDNFKKNIVPKEYRKYIGKASVNDINNISTHYMFKVRYKSEDVNRVKALITDMLFNISMSDNNMLSVNYI